jgi:hypothetical protein
VTALDHVSLPNTLHGTPRQGRYRAPTAALTAAGILLAISLFLPYWELTLITRDHPTGLRLASYLGHLEGPVEPVLAAAGVHGAASLLSLSELERSLAVAAGTVMSLLVIAATFVHNRWATLLALPALGFPAIVVADTARWMRPIVTGLAATEGSPPVPRSLPLFGELAVNGMVLEIHPAGGLALATAASLAVLGGLWLHRRAYKPRISEVSEPWRGAGFGERGGGTTL